MFAKFVKWAYIRGRAYIQDVKGVTYLGGLYTGGLCPSFLEFKL